MHPKRIPPAPGAHHDRDSTGGRPGRGQRGQRGVGGHAARRRPGQRMSPPSWAIAASRNPCVSQPGQTNGSEPSGTGAKAAIAAPDSHWASRRWLRCPAGRPGLGREGLGAAAGHASGGRRLRNPRRTRAGDSRSGDLGFSPGRRGSAVNRPTGDVHRRHRPAVRRARYRHACQRATQVGDLHPALIQRGVEAAVSALVFTGQGGLDQRSDRSLTAEHRVGHLGPRVGSSGRTGMELASERGGFPGAAVVSGWCRYGARIALRVMDRAILLPQARLMTICLKGRGRRTRAMGTSIAGRSPPRHFAGSFASVLPAPGCSWRSSELTRSSEQVQRRWPPRLAWQLRRSTLRTLRSPSLISIPRRTK